ncbi:MAG: hypothetical protein CENE_02577 [Candidatus Celerinatantimonas neptuna]|nr:MAG: hypothetical protein CENE_02577 [Candidatus Celerinatantimonas neptuna]
MANLSQDVSGQQDLSTMPVPEHAKMGKLSLTMAWWSVCSAVFYIVVGASLAMSYGAKNAIIGMVLSVVSYGVINAIISRYVISNGLSVALFSRRLFGKAGASLATLIFFLTAIYYAVFEGSVIAVAFNHLLPSLAYKWAALVVVLYSVPLIFGSVQHWLDKFNGVLLPFYLIGLAITIGVAVHEYGYQPGWIDAGPAKPVAYGWWHCFTYYMGVWVLMLYTFDFARFGRKQDSHYHARFNFGMPFYLVTFLLNGIVGIYLVSSIPQQGSLSELSVVMAILKLLGFLGLVFVWITQTRINTANYYLATINMQAFFEQLKVLKLSRLLWAVIVGALVYAMMLADVFTYLLQALAYQGVFVVAWVGAALAHIALNKGGEMPLEQVPMFYRPGLIAWFASTIAGMVIMHLSAPFSSFAAPITFVLSLLLYWGLTRADRPMEPVSA